MSQCEGTTQEGKRCKRTALPNERGCKAHIGKIDRKRKPREAKPIGRPSKIEDEDVRKLIYGLFAAGASVDDVCAEVGITPTTFYRWIEKGEDAEALLAEGYDLDTDEERYRDFREQSIRARRRLKVDTVRRLSKMIRDEEADLDVRQMIDVLQRLDREQWGRSETLNVNHAGSVDVNVVKRYGETLGEILKGIANDLNMTDEQKERWPMIVERNLRRFEAKEPA